tara:strand:+ start:1868 stop:2293 length:426 start_codon:yes stop_codon:yes gene_type:complete
MDKDTARFIDRIQKIKSKLRLNYKEIAEASGLQVSLVTRIFNGHQEPKLSEVAGIATALGTTMNYLVNHEDTEYMLSKTREIHSDCLKFQGELQQMAAWLEKTIAMNDYHLRYYEYILRRVDALKEHPAPKIQIKKPEFIS